jgi:tetratricopeptide (TPR) repeat protein
VVTLNEEVYVDNFKDYRFLQVFYPTRGILAWHDRATWQIRALPGGDDPHYVQTDGVWSPDGKYLIFARTEAKDADPAGLKAGGVRQRHERDPYSIRSVPHSVQWRERWSAGAGARRFAEWDAQPFPQRLARCALDCFVRSRNRQLVRLDDQLYILLAGGGQARRMRANTALMNSWHSFPTNGRWLVFSSKSRSPYTQMFLTRLDEAGRDSPPIRIENATAAKRAVKSSRVRKHIARRADENHRACRRFLRASGARSNLTEKGKDDAAIALWERALALDGENAKAHNNLGVLLTRKGKFDQALKHFQRATEIKPDDAQAHYNLGGVLWRKGKTKQAIAEWQMAGQTGVEDAEIHNDLSAALVRKGRLEEAAAHLRKAVPNQAGLRPGAVQFGRGAGTGRPVGGRIAEWKKALELKPDYVEAHYSLGLTLYLRGRIEEAMAQWREALRIAPDNVLVVNQMAWALATSPDPPARNGGQAVRLAEHAVELSAGRQSEVLDTLAAAYPEVGRFAEAVRPAAALSPLPRNRRSNPWWTA